DIPNSGGLTFTAGTLNLGSASAAQIDTFGVNGISCLSIQGTAVVNLAGTLDMNGSVTGNGGAGTLNMGSATIFFGGSSWANNSVFTANPGSSTFIIDTPSAISTSVTTGTLGSWNNIISTTTKTVTFQDGFTAANFTGNTPSAWFNFLGGANYNISGTFTLNGQAAGTKIRMRSTIIGTRYNLNVTSGVQSVYYVDVQDAEALGNDIYAYNSTNTGNTDAGAGTPQWVFGTVLLVTNTNDAGAGSLRAAMTAAVATNAIMFDTTVFLVGTPATINLLSTLPNISQGSITIDASNAGVILNGAGAGAGVSCLTLASNNNTVRGLRIAGCTANGILISSGTGNVIGGDRTAGSGPNGQGNTIVSNGIDGVSVSSTNNYIYGNYIGTDGTAALGNTANGVRINASTNTIGGLIAGQRNVIAGNGLDGITVLLAPANVVIQNNYIGTNATATAALANGGHGINVGSAANPLTIGGLSAAAGNVISGNTGSGIFVHNTTSMTYVYGNYIGTNAASAALPNTAMGLRLEAGQVYLGNAGEAQSNVIGANGGLGISETLLTSVLWLGGTVTVKDDVLFKDGSIILGTATLQVSGNFDYNVVDVNANGSTVVLNGTAAQSVTLATTANAQCTLGTFCFENLNVTNNTAPVTFTSVTGDSLTVKNLTAITPNTQLNFLGGLTHTISGILNLNGHATGTRVKLRSTNATQYALNVTGGAPTVSYVDVQYAAASTNDINAYYSLDSGFNDNGTATPQWVFNTSLLVTTTADSGNGSLRAAMTSAVAGDTILFDPNVFLVGSPATITTISALPNMSVGSVAIDASNAGVILNGASAGAGESGITI
ncbi:MAG: right-handed parallel beta-helix repeat-containing protein, partial [Gammaproteobacteria bacterium]|nr:right-handed parallel beta-helix repeat-containing protein [Gammaproteobacteria bacterium]